MFRLKLGRRGLDRDADLKSFSAELDDTDSWLSDLTLDLTILDARFNIVVICLEFIKISYLSRN